MPDEVVDLDSFPSERFCWQQTLGTGGFSNVFLCRDNRSGALVVVKTPRPLPVEQAAMNWFQDADVLTRVRHEIFPQSIERGFVDAERSKKPFHVLEYFDGISLYELLRRYGAMTPATALPILRILLEGLQFLHAQGFIHCDVTPANTLLRCDQLGWRLKLIDFGSARSIDNSEEQGPAARPLITPGFAAPELMDLQEGTPSADVYSFGCTAYYSLSGTSPDMGLILDRVPASVAPLISSCVTIDPTRRPAISQLLQEIDRLIRGGAPELGVVSRPAAVAPTTVAGGKIAVEAPSRTIPSVPLTAVGAAPLPRTGAAHPAEPPGALPASAMSPPLTVVAVPPQTPVASAAPALSRPSQRPLLQDFPPNAAPTQAAGRLLETFRKSIGRWIRPAERKDAGWARTSRDTTAAEQFESNADEVDCTVFAPPRIEQESSALIQVFLHLPEQSNAAASLAAQFDSDAAARGVTGLTAEVARGTPVMIELEAPGLEVSEPVQRLVWRGRPDSATFETFVPRSFAGSLAIATVRISIEGVPYGHVKFKTTIGPAAAVVEDPAVVHRWCRYRRAFISYCSTDRDEVLKRVQMLKRLRVEFFQDVLDLEPGAEWEPLLYRRIDECDVFLLFWSAAAGASEWVRKEFLYALDRKTRDANQAPELIPVILEGPPIPPPPLELKHLHFNDQILNFVSNRYMGSA